MLFSQFPDGCTPGEIKRALASIACRRRMTELPQKWRKEAEQMLRYFSRDEGEGDAADESDDDAHGEYDLEHRLLRDVSLSGEGVAALISLHTSRTSSDWQPPASHSVHTHHGME